MRPTPKDVTSIVRAYNFAATQHVDQRRKGRAAEPYLNHLTEVAELVALATGGADPGLICAAILHDVVEDTSATLAEVEAQFGSDVAGLVAEVTDDKSLPKQMRKDLQIEHARLASQRAQMLKLADKISNLRSLVASPPEDWSRDRMMNYGLWAAKVVEGCRGANADLAGKFDVALAALTDAE